MGRARFSSLRMASRWFLGATLALTSVTAAPAGAAADENVASRTVELRFTPAPHLQLAMWIERPDGTFLATVGLTQSVSYRGIGNRPGASQMNSGFRWPYGRREGVLPVWAHRRAAAPGAVGFKRVIFQERREGWASRYREDSSDDNYFCLSFREKTNVDQTSTREEALDAITCPSGFSSDKGRYMVAADVAAGYSEPTQVAGANVPRPLDLVSLYPPRRDYQHCTGGPICHDVFDVDSYNRSALDVMPELDAVTLATPPAGTEQSVMFRVPDHWPGGDYVAYVEANLEGDYNAAFNDVTYPTPARAGDIWDSWAHDYGYPYRGQPSVVYAIPFTIDATAGAGVVSFQTAAPIGYGDVDGFGPQGGALSSMDDGRVSDDPVAAPGSGADRLLADHETGQRVRVDVRNCPTHPAPLVPSQSTAKADPDGRHSHEWGVLHFVEPSSDQPVARYEIRFSEQPIVPDDLDSFMHAQPAVSADRDQTALQVAAGSPGQPIDVHFGGMSPLRHYYVGIRAVDRCGMPGPIAVAELETTRINFTKLSGCFIATAAYGSAMQPQVQALRAVRDALRPRSAIFATATDLYYRSGPAAAQLVAKSEAARALARILLGPPAAIAAAFSPAPGGAAEAAAGPVPAR